MKLIISLLLLSLSAQAGKPELNTNVGNDAAARQAEAARINAGMEAGRIRANMNSAGGGSSSSGGWMSWMGSGMSSISIPSNFSYMTATVESHAEVIEASRVREQRHAEEVKGIEESTRRAQKRLSEMKERRKGKREVDEEDQVVSVSDRISSGIQSSYKEKTDLLLKRLKQLPHQTNTLRHEIEKWDHYSGDKQTAIRVTSKIVSNAERLYENHRRMEKPAIDFVNGSIQAGLDAITEAVEVRGSEFRDLVDEADILATIGKEVLDIALGFTPGVSLGKDSYEAFTGLRLVDGKKLDITSRSFAVLGVATAGASHIVTDSGRAVYRLYKVFSKFKKYEFSGLKDVVAILKCNPKRVRFFDAQRKGPLSEFIIEKPLGKMTDISHTFRSAKYVSYTAQEPVTLYRVVPKHYNVRGAANGGYWTRTKPTGSTSAMIDSALDIKFGNTADQVIKVVVPAGTKLYEGRAASIQNIGSHISEFVGGGNQIFIPNMHKIEKISVEGWSMKEFLRL